MNLDELDLTAAESKVTYEEIKGYVLEHIGLKVSHLYIAQVKRKHGLLNGQITISLKVEMRNNRSALLKKKRRSRRY